MVLYIMNKYIIEKEAYYEKEHNACNCLCFSGTYDIWGNFHAFDGILIIS